MYYDVCIMIMEDTLTFARFQVIFMKLFPFFAHCVIIYDLSLQTTTFQSILISYTPLNKVGGKVIISCQGSFAYLELKKYSHAQIFCKNKLLEFWVQI